MKMTDHSGRDMPEGIIPYNPGEVDEYEQTSARYRAGEIPEAEFQAYRLRRGVYGQRQPDTQMVRIKIPLGCLTTDQLEVLGRVVGQHAPLRKGHFTTRENLQLHHVPLKETPELMRVLGTVGLTTREACGNVVRNVVGCPLAGVCPEEVFDATPYGAAFARYFVRRDFAQNMPRKVKVAFTGCREDHAITRIHDMGFAGRVRREDGLAGRGFRIVVGGGTSIEPLLARELYGYVAADDGAYLRVAEAVLRVFNRSDELRRNRMRARIKILVNRVGIDTFREMVEEELRQRWAQEPVALAPLLFVDREQEDAPALPPSAPRPRDGSSRFLKWLETNAVAQKQAGYHAVFVTLPLGDVTAEQFPVLAEVARRYGSGRIRTTQDQNLVLRWVPGASLYEAWTRLEAIGLGEPGAQRITDVVACPGTDSCKLGITSSMGLGRAIRGVLLQSPDLIEDPLIERLHVKISGCPNGCGQHHIADLGFHGAAVKGDQKLQVPAYEVFLGGRCEGGEVRYGARLRIKVPAKAVPQVIRAFLALYRDHREPGELFHAFVDRIGRDPFEQIATQLAEIPPFAAERPAFYQDWERTVLYRVERGEGECAV